MGCSFTRRRQFWSGPDPLTRALAGALRSLSSLTAKAVAPRAKTRPIPTRATARTGEPLESSAMLTIAERRAGLVAGVGSAGVRTAGAGAGAGAAGRPSRTLAGAGANGGAAGAGAGAAARAGAGTGRDARATADR